MSWTEQQIQALKQMWGNGFSASDIAKSLGGGMTRNAVIGKAHRLKLSLPLATAQPSESALSKNGTFSAIVKPSKKRVMLRPLPPLPTAEKMPVKQQVVEAEQPAAILSKRIEGIAVTKAGERHCRWPIGDPRSPEFRFCGCNTYESLPYCVDHARVAYQTVSKKSRGADVESTPEFRTSGNGRY